jgi:hypothetical protein
MIWLNVSVSVTPLEQISKTREVSSKPSFMRNSCCLEQQIITARHATALSPSLITGSLPS